MTIMRMETLVIGKRLAHYEIRSKIGAGGMGEVYRALDTKLEREIALKILPPQMAQDPDRRQRFEREAKAVAALRHPHIVTIHSVEEAEGYTFLTMELLEGNTLGEAMPPGGFPLEKFLDIAIPIADAVGHAHSKGITHRDLKPANVMLEHGRHVKVLDFGLAKMMAPGAEGQTATVVAGNLTGEGRVLGTASYMAPEQAEGKPTDPRSDIFSLGVLFYEMITGERPFKGTNEITTLSSILRDTPTPVTEVKPTLPRHLGRVIRRCLEKDPARRYDTARALGIELETLREEMNSGVAPEPSVPPSSAGASPEKSAPPSWGTPQSVPPAPSNTGTGAAVNASADAWSASRTQPPASMPPASLAPAPKSRRRTWIVVGCMLGLAAVVAGAALFRARGARGPRTAPPAVAAAAKSAPERATIVVFPFENLGPADDAYFSAGVTDEIMSRLARVPDLAVLSRTTSTHYDRKGKTMQQVVADLGVQYVLDGTVRWERLPGGKSRMRVTPQLIRAADDTQMWTSSYDHSMEEIFQVQSEIANEVVDRLGFTLRGGAREALESVPTENVDAYQAYLRGKEIMDRFTLEPDAWRLGIQMFERAVKFDPEFVDAQAQLSKAYSGLVHFEWERSDAVLAKAKAAADRALQLDPDSAWAHMALGYYYYWGRKEYDAAEAEFARADRLLPNQAEFKLAIGFIRRRQGRFQEALEMILSAEKLDPRNNELLYTLGETYTLLGRYAEAEAAFDGAIQIAPDGVSSYAAKALSALLAGDPARARALLDAAPASTNPDRLAISGVIELNARSFDRALEFAGQLPDFREAQFDLICRPLRQGLVYAFMKQPEQARPALEAALPLIEGHLKGDPTDANTCSALALAYAGLGRKQEAIRQATRALDLFPANQDKWIRQHRVFDLMLVNILCGESDAAIDQLEELLQQPTNRVSVPLLRISPFYDSLRSHPRFKRLLAKTT